MLEKICGAAVTTYKAECHGVKSEKTTETEQKTALELGLCDMGFY